MPVAQFAVSVVENQELTGGYFRIVFETPASAPLRDTRPGQFVMLRGGWGRDLLNGRAFSVLSLDGARQFSVLAKVFGRGTALMKRMRAGDSMTCTGPLGSHFPEGAGAHQILVAGGVGLPPLQFHAHRAAAAGAAAGVEMLYGGKSAADLVLVDELERIGVRATLVTEDGSRGARGMVTAPLRARLEQARAGGETVAVLACGPTAMLAAVRELGLEHAVSTHLCLEEQMACGYGVCLGCAVPVYGPKPYKYCCTDGPVFPAHEVRWS